MGLASGGHAVFSGGGSWQRTRLAPRRGMVEVTAPQAQLSARHSSRWRGVEWDPPSSVLCAVRSACRVFWAGISNVSGSAGPRGWELPFGQLLSPPQQGPQGTTSCDPTQRALTRNCPLVSLPVKYSAFETTAQGTRDLCKAIFPPSPTAQSNIPGRMQRAETRFMSPLAQFGRSRAVTATRVG